MMKVVTNENDLLVAEVIREHLIAIAGDAVVVRAEKFYATGLDFNMVIIILDKMKDASLLDGSYHSWGFLTGKKKDSAWVFEETTDLHSTLSLEQS